MKRGSEALLAAALLAPTVSQAQEPQAAPFSYTYVEAAYEESDFDFGAGEISGDGIALSGSFAITEDWHAFAAYGNSDLDFGIDVDTWAIGAGYRYPLRSDLDVYGRVLYLTTEVDAPGPGPGDIDEDGPCRRACDSASPMCSRWKVGSSTSMSSTATLPCKRARDTTSRGTCRPASVSRLPAIPMVSASTLVTRSSSRRNARGMTHEPSATAAASSAS